MIKAPPLLSSDCGCDCLYFAVSPSGTSEVLCSDPFKLKFKLKFEEEAKAFSESMDMTGRSVRAFTMAPKVSYSADLIVIMMIMMIMIIIMIIQREVSGRENDNQIKREQD
jgi:hypothetical protein